MKIIGSFLFVMTLAVSPAVAADVDTPHAEKTLEIFTRIISIESVKNSPGVREVADYLAGELIDAGFPREDVEVVPVGQIAALIVRYRGDGSSGRGPILLLGHMDVVEAKREDCVRPPFELTRDDTFFYGRGTMDNKFGVAQLTSTFIRLLQEGFVPDRDLYLVFSGDEESGMVSTHLLANDRPELAAAEFALNSDAGYGAIDDNGNALTYVMQTAEKTYVTWELTVRNPGGHSSEPRPDNAIYDLARAITRIEEHRFPVRWSDATVEFLDATGRELGGELGDAMVRFAANPEDTSASDRIAVESPYVGMTRTTCVATMLRGGHAENALPQSATVTVNCRVFPGEPIPDVLAGLQRAVGNDAVEFKEIYAPVASPASELPEEVRAAIDAAVRPRYPEVRLLPWMSSYGTDGTHFRNAGIPTFGVSAVFMNPKDEFSHGLNERVPIKAFYDGLDHWSIIIRELTGD